MTGLADSPEHRKAPPPFRHGNSAKTEVFQYIFCGSIHRFVPVSCLHVRKLTRLSVSAQAIDYTVFCQIFATTDFCGIVRKVIFFEFWIDLGDTWRNFFVVIFDKE